MKKHIRTAIIVLVMIIVALVIPFPDSDVNLNFYFENLNTEGLDECSFRIYYLTDDSPYLSESQTVNGIVDSENNKVTFKLGADYVDDLYALRIDFPAISQDLCINGMSVSSGGFAQKQIDPSRFLTDENIIYSYDISLTRLTASCKVYAVTGSEDPQIILSDVATDYIASKKSNHIVSRLVILSLMIAGFVCYKKVKW